MRHRSVVRMSENMLLARIFVPESEGVTGGWGKLHNKEMQDLCPSQKIIRTNKSRLMRFSGLMAGVEENKNLYIVSAGKI